MNERSIPNSSALSDIPYDHSRFDKGYYHGERRGLVDYEYDSKTQKHQLPIKFHQISRFGHIGKTLFLGCARGFEVRYFREKGIDAWGIDVSKWAIENSHPVQQFCQHYDGHTFPFENDSFDVVAAFDVLQLPPDDIAARLISEMARVSRRFIYFRNHVRAPYEQPGLIHGMDGVTISSRSFDFYMGETMRIHHGKTFGPMFGQFAYHLEFDFWFETYKNK